MDFTSPSQKLLLPLFFCSNVSIILKNVLSISGLVDTIGHSHQWWHILIFLGLFFWHETGIVFAMFRLKHGCDFGVLSEDQRAELVMWPFHWNIFHSIKQSFIHVCGLIPRKYLVEEWHSRPKSACYKNHTLSPSPHSDCLHKFTIVYLCVW